MENNNNWKTLVLFLKEVAEQKEITDYELAKRTGYATSTITRVFNLAWCPKLEIFLDIAKALEVNMFFETRDSTTDLNQAFEKAMDKLGRRSDNLPKN